MSELRDIVEFTSELFSPVLPEDSQVNPEVYGAELAYWLCVELAKRGIVTSYPSNEDWGWYIEYLPPSGSEFAVHCGNVGGARNQWLLSLRRHGKKLFGRDKPPYAEAQPLIASIKDLIESENRISGVQWIYESGHDG